MLSHRFRSQLCVTMQKTICSIDCRSAFLRYQSWKKTQQLGKGQGIHDQPIESLQLVRRSSAIPKAQRQATGLFCQVWTSTVQDIGVLPKANSHRGLQ
jgi:hypothetical protein